MKFRVDRAPFLKALGHAQGIVERRSSKPILSHILLQADRNGLSLISTNTQAAIVERLQAEVEIEGATTLAAHTLCDIVRKLSDTSPVELFFKNSSSLSPLQEREKNDVLSHEESSDTLLNLASLSEEEREQGGQETVPADSRVLLKSGRSQFKLTHLPATDYPQLTQTHLTHRFTMAAPLLRTLLDHTRFAMSPDEARINLAGIYFHATLNEGHPVLRLVSTDGHRLALMETPLPLGAEGMPSVILGRKAVLEVRKLLEETDESITVALSEKRIEFVFPSAVFTACLVASQFPDYEGTLRTYQNAPIMIATKDFAAAVDRVSTVVEEKTCELRLKVQGENLSLFVHNALLGAGEETVEADSLVKDPFEVGLNARYLMDALAHITTEETAIYCEWSDPLNIAWTFQNAKESHQEAHAKFIIMPFRS